MLTHRATVAEYNVQVCVLQLLFFVAGGVRKTGKKVNKRDEKEYKSKKENPKEMQKGVGKVEGESTR